MTALFRPACGKEDPKFALEKKSIAELPYQGFRQDIPDERRGNAVFNKGVFTREGKCLVGIAHDKRCNELSPSGRWFVSLDRDSAMPTKPPWTWLVDLDRGTKRRVMSPDSVKMISGGSFAFSPDERSSCSLVSPRIGPTWMPGTMSCESEGGPAVAACSSGRVSDAVASRCE